MATQQAQIETLISQNRSLESRLSKASQNLHQSTPQPQPAAAAKRKATTSTETLRSEEDTTARIIQTANSSVAEALRTTVHATVADAVRAAVTEAFATMDSRLTNMETRLASMETTHNQEAPSTGTLVHKSLTAKQHDLEFPDIPHTVVEILPRKRSHQSLFVLNVYCAPRARADDFHLLFRKTTSLARGAQLLILGDFNARHPDWGYLQANKRGKKLWQLSQDLRLTLLNDPQQSPTRIGNSVCRDTSPDLADCKHIAHATWENTCQLAGSDHYIIAVKVQTSAGKKVTNALARITEWPKFREVRESEAPNSITNLKEWTASLNDHVRRTTRESRAADETPATDSRLLHMWDAHASLLRRWQKQRHNKKLRRRMQALSDEIERHSAYLARQQWGQLCNGLNGQLGNNKTWHLLRHLLDSDNSKTAARHRLKRLVHKHPGSDEDLL
ncbi:hypothetical protein MTO96_034479, partial [Rhipicephalus appendiculatus]